MDLSFKQYAYRRQEHVPQADRVFPIIKSAGPVGLNRKQIGHAVDLHRDSLDDLLNGLIQIGWINGVWRDGDRVFVASGAK